MIEFSVVFSRAYNTFRSQTVVEFDDNEFAIPTANLSSSSRIDYINGYILRRFIAHLDQASEAQNLSTRTRQLIAHDNELLLKDYDAERKRLGNDFEVSIVNAWRLINVEHYSKSLTNAEVNLLRRP